MHLNRTTVLEDPHVLIKVYFVRTKRTDGLYLGPLLVRTHMLNPKKHETITQKSVGALISNCDQINQKLR